MRVVALAGGVGGAKLAHGLYQRLAPDELTVIVNTGDDFDLYGLRICPDADTVLYTLAGLANEETGWGVAGDTWAALDMLGRYGAERWFRVGDRDLATHLVRTERLRAEVTLTATLGEMTRALGVRARLLPMTDDPAPTIITTPDGDLAFQDYFVRRGQRDPVVGVRLEGAAAARLTPEVRMALAEAEVIVFCPSNPIVSIGPILAVPGMRDAVREARAVKVAISPIVGGKALKGPAEQMLRGLGHEASAFGVATLYHDLLDGMVVDHEDAAETERITALGVRVLITDTIMRAIPDRARLAGETLQFAEKSRGGGHRRAERGTS